MVPGFQSKRHVKFHDLADLHHACHLQRRTLTMLAQDFFEDFIERDSGYHEIGDILNGWCKN